MTVSAISAANASPVSNFQTIRQALGQLTDALNNNDPTDAQDAYNTLAASPLAQGNNPFAQAIQQIGQDLQNGDLAGAQKALVSLQQAHGHHHHHHGGGETSGASNASGNTNANNSDGSDSTAETSIQIQITVTSESQNQVDVTA